MIIRDREFIESGLSKSFLLSCIKEHLAGLERLEEIEKVYNSQPEIMTRVVPKGYSNNKLVHNFARYIVAVASGYLVGSPISYAPENGEDLSEILRAYKLANADSVDAELAKDASLFGRGAELVFADVNAQPKVVALEPKEAFVVYSCEADAQPLVGIRVFKKRNEKGEHAGFTVETYTDSQVVVFEGRSIEAALESPVRTQAHYFGAVPIIEYWNNDDETGDFEHVLSLINAYDKLKSDRVNDKEQFVQSILLMTGARMEDEPDKVNEDGQTVRGRTVAQQIREDRMIFLPDIDAKAEYLIKQLSEADASILSKEIKEDIHKFSMVPDLTDSEFAGNASGVAMKYKLFGLEQLTKIKERWFKEGLKQRLRLIINYLRVKGARVPDAEDIKIVFKRSLPANEVELAQMIGTLNGIVPKSELLAQLPFVEDPREALIALREEQADELKRNQEAFGFPMSEGDESVEAGDAE